MSETKQISDFTDEHKAIAEQVLHTNEFAKMIGMRLIDMKPNEATIEIEMRDQLRQPHGLLHGGVTATLIDTAMAFAVITVLTREEKASTVDLNVHYLRPHLDGKIFCTAKIVKAGKRFLTVSAEVVNEQGKLIATALSTYTKV
ncbi:MAG: PaaI family thioesterase [Pyrinomonadaceae bacterium]